MADDACNVDTHKVFNSNLCCHNDILIPDADFFKAPCLSEIGFNSYFTLFMIIQKNLIFHMSLVPTLTKIK